MVKDGLDVRWVLVSDYARTHPRNTSHEKPANTTSIHSKEIDSFITKIKKDYQRHIQGDKSDKPQAHSQDDGKLPIHGGGLEEWKRQNAKIINNGMILADEDAARLATAAADASDKSRASTVEPSSSVAGVELAKTPRSLVPTMFTAINRGAEGSSGVGGGADSQHPSPMQAYQSLPGGSGGDGDLTAHSAGQQQEGDLDIMQNISEWEGSRIAECLGDVGGDIQGFSYGDVPETNLLFGQIVPLMGFGGYS